ncbi:MAG: hypothetical protein WCP97_03435 [bacterium]
MLITVKSVLEEWPIVDVVSRIERFVDQRDNEFSILGCLLTKALAGTTGSLPQVMQDLKMLFSSDDPHLKSYSSDLRKLCVLLDKEIPVSLSDLRGKERLLLELQNRYLKGAFQPNTGLNFLKRGQIIQEQQLTFSALKQFLSRLAVGTTDQLINLTIPVMEEKTNALGEKTKTWVNWFGTTNCTETVSGSTFSTEWLWQEITGNTIVQTFSTLKSAMSELGMIFSGFSDITRTKEGTVIRQRKMNFDTLEGAVFQHFKITQLNYVNGVYANSEEWNGIPMQVMQSIISKPATEQIGEMQEFFVRFCVEKRKDVAQHV